MLKLFHVSCKKLGVGTLAFIQAETLEQAQEKFLVGWKKPPKFKLKEITAE